MAECFGNEAKVLQCLCTRIKAYVKKMMNADKLTGLSRLSCLSMHMQPSKKNPCELMMMSFPL